MLLRDGHVAHIRPIHADDQALLVDFYDQVSAESKYLRFFAPMPTLSERDVLRFTNVDHHDRVAFVMTVANKMIAVGRFDRIPPTTGGASPSCCSSTSRRPAGKWASAASSPTSCPRTGR